MKIRRDVYQAIADPTRRAILALLITQNMTAGDIASNFDSARPTISKHIKILQESELIDSDRRGREIHYRLKVEKMKEIDNWLDSFRKIWKNRFNSLDNLLDKLKNE